ncbi:MAG: ExbD/TolR family protein [Candidatus Wallacebacter cryptica]
MEFKRRQRNPFAQPDMTPMIDVIFHLLIFFMAFSVLHQTQMSIQVELPKAVSGSDVQSQVFEISVSQDGVIYHNNKMVTGPELEQALTEALAVNPNLAVVVSSDRRATVEQWVSAMDIVSKVGIDTIHIGTRQP